MSRRRAGPRPAVVGTCTLSPYKVPDPDQLLADGLAMVDGMARRAAEKGWSLDLVALPETFSQVEHRPGDETLDGRTLSAMAEKARAYPSRRSWCGRGWGHTGRTGTATSPRRWRRGAGRPSCPSRPTAGDRAA